MVVQHVNVAEGGQAIVGNVNARPRGGGTRKNGARPHALAMHLALRSRREVEKERVAVPRAGSEGG